MPRSRRAPTRYVTCAQAAQHGGWGGRPQCQEWAKGALDEYEFNYDYDAHLKKFMRQSFRVSPYARVEYANQDAQGYASDEPLSPLEGEATAAWDPHVDYADTYVHQPWCRGSCSLGATQRDVRQTLNGTVMMTTAVAGVATRVLAPTRLIRPG